MNIVRALFFLLSPIWLVAQGLAPDIANYEINVSLDADKKQLEGQELITWQNTSPVEVSEIQMHLYLNAFRKGSSFLKESKGKLRSDKKTKDGIGNTYITQLKVKGGPSLLSKMTYIQPDDLNKEDRTVVSVKLNKPVLPGQKIQLELTYRAKLPKVFARTGYGDDNYFLVGQWFPKIGVWEKNKEGVWSWNCHQYHAHTEFYADFGTYDVNITLPRTFKVGATGQKVGELNLKDNLKTVRYKADDVHDFAWTASPHFDRYEETYKGILMQALMQPEHASQYKRYFEALRTSIDYFEQKVAPYPHKTITVVDPPVSASGSGGMEYPTFITAGSFWGVGAWAKFAELVTVHEFGHQYFQGILASNEFEQSFMDEGFNQYFEGRIFDAHYPNGASASIFGFHVNDLLSSRNSYVTMEYPKITEIDREAWKYPGGTYSVMTYTKTATALKTFENLIGEPAMDAVIKAYYKKWSFKHPYFNDFVEVANTTLGNDYSWYFNQAFKSSEVCDYAVDTVYVKNGKSKVVLVNKGKFHLPQNVEVTFEDNTTLRFIWEGKNAKEILEYPKVVKSVMIDPEHKNLMDLDWTNNGFTTEMDSLLSVKYFMKYLNYAELWILSFLTWIG